MGSRKTRGCSGWFEDQNDARRPVGNTFVWFLLWLLMLSSQQSINRTPDMWNILTKTQKAHVVARLSVTQIHRPIFSLPRPTNNDPMCRCKRTDVRRSRHVQDSPGVSGLVYTVGTLCHVYRISQWSIKRQVRRLIEFFRDGVIRLF